MVYHFNVDHAQRFGVDESILLENLIFWIRRNRANGLNFHDGRTWTYNSVAAYGTLFPFWSARQIDRILKSLIRQKVIRANNFNERAYDRTLWYALEDETLLEMPAGGGMSSNSPTATISPNREIDSTRKGGGLHKTVEPIPDPKPDSKPNREEEALASSEVSRPTGDLSPGHDSTPSLPQKLANTRGTPHDDRFKRMVLSLLASHSPESIERAAVRMAKAKGWDKVIFLEREWPRWDRGEEAGEKKSAPSLYDLCACGSLKLKTHLDCPWCDEHKAHGLTSSGSSVGPGGGAEHGGGGPGGDLHGVAAKAPALEIW